MIVSRANILLFLVASALGGCVTDAHSDDPDLDSDLDLADPADRRRPPPPPAPDPGGTCTRVGGPSTLGASLDGIDYRVTGGPTGNGDGTSLHMTQTGWATLHTSNGSTEEGWLDGLTLYGLFHRVNNAQLPTLCAMYTCAECTGDYVHNLTVWLNRIPYTVRASFRSAPPDRLTALITAVRNIGTSSLQ